MEDQSSECGRSVQRMSIQLGSAFAVWSLFIRWGSHRIVKGPSRFVFSLWAHKTPWQQGQRHCGKVNMLQNWTLHLSVCVLNEVSLSVEASTEELKDDECLGRILKMSSERVWLLDYSETRGIRPASSWDEKQRSWMSNLAVKFRPFTPTRLLLVFIPQLSQWVFLRSVSAAGTI